ELVFLHPAEDTRIDIRMDSREASRADSAPPVAVEGTGQWRGNDFSLEGRVASLLELQQPDAGAGYGVDLRARAGRTSAHARGRLFNPFQFQRFDVQMQLEGANLHDLYPLLGNALPPAPAYTLAGRLGRNRNVWTYEESDGA